jgi:hypothetical protein
MTALTGKVGFASPISEKVSSRKSILGIELIATLALAVCLIIAATAVSIGMARAQSISMAGANCYAHTALRPTHESCVQSPALMPAALMTGHHFSISDLL